jgi:pyrroloquinoline quinone (PQQ) biosynthesis protein C
MGNGLLAEAVSAEAALERIQGLARSASRHAAIRNEFYQTWMAGPLDVRHVELVAVNFYARVRRTPDRIALAFLSMQDVAARAETVENLSDETGRGNPNKVHSVILRAFWETLISKMRNEPVSFDDISAPVLPSTTKLVDLGEKVFSSPYPQEACGALLAQEWHAYPQLVHLYEGVRNYRHLFELEEFHENCEYFYLHIGATEKEHKVHSLATAARTCRTEEDLVHLERGFTTYLDLLAENWHEIYQTIKAG